MFHNDCLRMRGELSLSIGRVIARPDETVASKVPLAGGCSRPRVEPTGGLEHPSHELRHIRSPKTAERRFIIHQLPVMTAIIATVIVPITLVIANCAERAPDIVADD
jgi:hypothetical protein